jgi:ABC-type transport system substrate-binding protein
MRCAGHGAKTCCKRGGAKARALRGLFMSELKLRPPKRQCGGVFGAAVCLMLCVTVVGAGRVEPSRRPKYGGALRMEIGAIVNSLDPTATAANQAEAAAKEKIGALLYEGRNADGTFAGTAGSGPFRMAEWEPGKHLVLAANTEFSGGRPFVDSVEIHMGRAARDRLLDLELDKADLVEIPPEEARQATERGIRVSTSQPDELVAVAFVAGRPAGDDARVREALARSLDRPAMVNFILQREGEPAGGLLPQWSSGTAFLYSTAADVARAKELVAQIGQAPQIVLGYDSGDSLEQSLAERIAVNAREAGIRLTAQESPEKASGAAGYDARLIRLRMPSPHPRAALVSAMAAIGPVIGPITGLELTPPAEDASAQQIYEIERGVVDSYRVIPLVWLPQVYGVGARVRNWKAPSAGEGWPLGDVWLEQESP